MNIEGYIPQDQDIAALSALPLKCPTSSGVMDDYLYALTERGYAEGDWPPNLHDPLTRANTAATVGVTKVHHVIRAKKGSKKARHVPGQDVIEELQATVRNVANLVVQYPPQLYVDDPLTHVQRTSDWESALRDAGQATPVGAQVQAAWPDWEQHLAGVWATDGLDYVAIDVDNNRDLAWAVIDRVRELNQEFEPRMVGVTSAPMSIDVHGTPTAFVAAYHGVSWVTRKRTYPTPQAGGGSWKARAMALEVYLPSLGRFHTIQDVGYAGAGLPAGLAAGFERDSQAPFYEGKRHIDANNVVGLHRTWRDLIRTTPDAWEQVVPGIKTYT